MGIRRALATSVIAFSLIACASPENVAESDGTWVGTVTSEGNVTTVINESGSVWGGTARLVEEASIGVDVGEEPYMLGSIVAITASNDRIYLLDEKPPKVRVYDLDGAHVLDIGREGQGPGELNRAYSIGIRADGKLLVHAGGNARINVFSPDGELLHDWPLQGGPFWSSTQMVMMTDGTVYTWLPAGDRDERGIRGLGMVPLSMDGELGDPILLPEGEPTLTLGRISGTSSSVGFSINRDLIVPFSPRTRSGLSPVGAIVSGSGDRYRFEARKFDGSVLVVERIAEPVPVDAEEASWYRRYITAQALDLDPSWSWSGPDIPVTKPYFSAFYADHDGRIWVRRPGPGRRLPDCDEDPYPAIPGRIARCWEDSELVDVFGPDGRYLGDIEFPDGALLRPDQAFFVRGDMVLLRLEDEAGTIMVKRYRLVLPGEQARIDISSQRIHQSRSSPLTGTGSQ